MDRRVIPSEEASKLQTRCSPGYRISCAARGVIDHFAEPCVTGAAAGVGVGTTRVAVGEAVGTGAGVEVGTPGVAVGRAVGVAVGLTRAIGPQANDQITRRIASDSAEVIGLGR